MKKLNRIISVMLILSMLLASLPVTVFAEGEEITAAESVEAEQADAAETPAEEISSMEEPPAEQPVTEITVSEPADIQPASDAPAADNTGYEEPSYTEPAADQPVNEEPVNTDPVIDQQTVTESAEQPESSEPQSVPESEQQTETADNTVPEATVPAVSEGQEAAPETPEAPVQINEILTGIDIRVSSVGTCFKIENGFAGYDRKGNAAVIYLSGSSAKVTVCRPAEIGESELEAGWSFSGADVQNSAYGRLILKDSGEKLSAYTASDDQVGSEVSVVFEFADHGGEYNIRELAVSQCEIEVPTAANTSAEEQQPSAETEAAPAEEAQPAENDIPASEQETPAAADETAEEPVIPAEASDTVTGVTQTDETVPEDPAPESSETESETETEAAEAETSGEEDHSLRFAASEQVLAVGQSMTLDVLNAEDKDILVGIAGDTDAVQWDESTLTLTGLAEGKVTAFLSTVDTAEVQGLAEINVVNELPAEESGWSETEGGLRNAPPAEFTPEWMADLRLDHDYMALKIGTAQIELTLLGIPDTIAPSDISVTWDIRDTDGKSITTTDSLKITSSSSTFARVAPMTKAGYGIITAVVKLFGDDDYVFEARCRIDVLEDTVANEITGASLVEKKTTVELFKTDYPRIKVVLEFPQNLNTASTASSTSTFSSGLKLDPAPGAIQSALFADLDTNNYFNLIVVDDRTLEIHPDPIVFTESSKVKSSYKSAIEVTGDGWTAVTDILTLSVKKTMPKIKVQTVKFNSFNDLEEKPIVFTGDALSSVKLDESKTKPDWLDLNAGTFSLQLKAEAKNIKKTEKVYLLVKFADFDSKIERPVSFSVSAASTPPKLTFKPTNFTINPKAGDKAATKWYVDMSEYNAGPVEVDCVKFGRDYYYTTAEIETKLKLKCTITGHDITLETLSDFDATTAKTFTVYFTIAGAKKAGTFTLKTLADKAAPSISLSVIGKINPAVDGSPATVTVKPKNFILPESPYDVKITKYDKTLKTEIDITADGIFTITPDPLNGNIIVITGDSATNDDKYFVYVEGKAEGKTVTAKAAFTVKTDIKAVKSVKFQMLGQLDVIRTDRYSYVWVAPKFTNWYNYTLKDDDLLIYKREGSGYTLYDNSAHPFVIQKDPVSDLYIITMKEDHASNTKTDKWYFRMKDTGWSATDPDNNIVPPAKYIQIPVKMGTAKMTQSVKEINLLRNDRFDSGTIRIGTNDDSLTDEFVVELAKTKGSEYFELVEAGKGVYTIHYKDNKVSVPAPTKSVKLTLNLTHHGNNTNVPNVKIPLTVKIVDTKPKGTVTKP